jgi:hypothetical protein
MQAYGFNLGKFAEICESSSKVKEISIKIIAEMHKQGIKTENEKLDEKLHNLALRGINGQR